jgi:two-component system response regulator FlrC
MLLQYPWPGNVRELENVMRRAMVLCQDQVLTPNDLIFDEAMPMPDLSDAGYGFEAASTHAAPPVSTPMLAMPATSFGTVHAATHVPGTAHMAATAVAPATSDLAPWPLAEAPTHNSAPAAAATPQDLQSAARLNEHQVIMATLASTPNKIEAAKRLGISPRTLRYKLAQLRELGLGLAVAS